MKHLGSSISLMVLKIYKLVGMRDPLTLSWNRILGGVFSGL